ncbi:hypothetical protein D3C85_885330 [compost metagenome]
MKPLTSAIKLSCLKTLVAIMAFLLTLEAGYTQTFQFSGTRQKDAINFLLIKNLIIIPVYINERGPFNFILDTGVGPMIISDPALTDSLKLKDLRVIKIAGLGKGNEIEAFVSRSISAKVGKSSIDQIPTAILKEDLFRLSGYVGMPIHGLLGYHFFKSFIVDVKYSSKRLVFFLPDLNRKIKGERIPLEMINDKPYAIVNIESADLGNIPIKVLIDNGASHAISLEILNEKPFPVPSASIQANLGMGLGGPISGNIGRIATLKIGEFSLKKVLTSFPKYDEVAGKILLKDRNGNLGADVLSRFDIVFDYGDNSMYLRRNSNFKRPFEHDMAGMEVYADGPDIDHYFISRIEPDSPAEHSGLEPEDEIVYINFVPATGFTLTEVNRILRAGDGKSVIITVLRQGQLHIKLLKLKQRI